MRKTCFAQLPETVLARVPRILLLPLCAVLMGLCLMFPKIGMLQWLALIPALWYLFQSEEKGMRLRRAYGLGCLYFGAFYLVVWHWFVELYPMTYSGVTKGEAVVLIAICWVGLSLLQTVLSALAFPTFVLLARHRVVRRFPVLKPFLFAAAYTVAEWAQTLTWAGVPFARLSLGQSECGVLFNSPALFGSYFITFSLVAVNALAAYALLHLDRAKLLSLCCALLMLVNVGAGLVGYLTADTVKDNGIVVAAVQGNVGTSNKWTEDSDKSSREIYERYTAEAVAAGAQLVLFPETFMPYRIADNTALGVYVKELAVKYQVSICCGGFYYDDAESGYYNGLFTVYPDGTISETVYAKRRPVPFGEYVPMRGLIEVLLPPLADMSMLGTDIDAGTDTAITDTAIGRIGGLICFDSIYESLTLDTVRDGAEVICLATNDSWFLDSAGVRMHYRHARLRAIESGRYIIRAADTGISAVIAPNGKTAAELPALTEGVSISTVQPNTSRTLYSHIGNLLVYLLIAAELALATDGMMQFLLKRKKERAER